MSVQHMGRTIPDDDTGADLPRTFRDFVDSGPLPRFADASERDAAITAPVMGQMVYMLDSGEILRYDDRDAAWMPWVPHPSEASNFQDTEASGTVNSATFTVAATSPSGATEFPEVEIYTGPAALVIASCYGAARTLGTGGGYFGFVVSGATSIPAADDNASGYESVGPGERYAMTMIRRVDLTPGLNKFQIAARVHTGLLPTYTFYHPRLQVIPLAQ